MKIQPTNTLKPLQLKDILVQIEERHREFSYI